MNFQSFLEISTNDDLIYVREIYTLSKSVYIYALCACAIKTDFFFFFFCAIDNQFKSDMTPSCVHIRRFQYQI